MELKGIRHNEGKPRFDLLHPISIQGLVDVLTYGAIKYPPKNWELSMSWSKVIASLKRHLQAIEMGEDYDKETGLLHIDHLACNAHFLSAYYKIAPHADDRRKPFLHPKKIALDVDDIICDFCGGWCEFFNVPQMKAWNFSYKTKEMFEQINKTDFWKKLKPLINPDDMPFEPYCYITSRSVPQSTTEQWIEKNGFPCSPVYSVGYDVSKLEVLKKCGCDVFVDDRYETFVEANNAGILTYLFTTEHNKRYSVGHLRINNLNELPV